jgi:hypothetical protein
LLKKSQLSWQMDPVGVRTNCAFLLAAFMIVEMKYSVDKAWEPFKSIGSTVLSAFRDASPDSPQDYSLTIRTCLQALERAIKLGWYDPRTFDADEYDYLDDPLNADMHIVSPKLAAFRGPADMHARNSGELAAPHVHVNFLFWPYAIGGEKRTCKDKSGTESNFALARGATYWQVTTACNMIFPRCSVSVFVSEAE